jgi:hypothetical protein
MAEASEDDEYVDIDDTPEHDRLDRTLAVSSVGKRLGEGEGVRETTFDAGESNSVFMTVRSSNWPIGLE